MKATRGPERGLLFESTFHEHGEFSACSCTPLYFFEWVWRGRDEKFRTVKKSDTVPGVQKLENTCFWDFYIPTEMTQMVLAPSRSDYFEMFIIQHSPQKEIEVSESWYEFRVN